MAYPDISKLNNEELLKLAAELAKTIRDSLPMKLYAGSFTLKSKLPYKATEFRELLIHRISDIADVTIEMYENTRIVPAFILTRAVIETTALIYWLHVKSVEFSENNDVGAFDEFLMKGMFGSRDKTTKLESYNVITAVDQLEKKFNGVKEAYERLCEFTHPNWSGVMGSYSKTDYQNFTTYLGKEHANPPVAFGLTPLIAALMVFIEYYNALGDVLKGINDAYEQRANQS